MQRILLIVVVLLVVWRILASIGRRMAERAPGAEVRTRTGSKRRAPAASLAQRLAVAHLGMSRSRRAQGGVTAP